MPQDLNAGKINCTTTPHQTANLEWPLRPNSRFHSTSTRCNELERSRQTSRLACNDIQFNSAVSARKIRALSLDTTGCIIPVAHHLFE
eukprot:6314129-Amphidinium_carterae.2